MRPVSPFVVPPVEMVRPDPVPRRYVPLVLPRSDVPEQLAARRADAEQVAAAGDALAAWEHAHHALSPADRARMLEGAADRARLEQRRKPAEARIAHGQGNGAGGVEKTQPDAKGEVR